MTSFGVTLLLLLASQDPEPAKMAAQRQALMRQFAEFDAIDLSGEAGLTNLKDGYRALEELFTDFLWTYEEYAPTYEALILMGHSQEKMARALQGTDPATAEKHWKVCLLYLQRGRKIFSQPVFKNDPEARRCVLLSAALEGEARLGRARLVGGPEASAQARQIGRVAHDVAPGAEELRASEHAARIRLNEVRAHLVLLQGKEALEAISGFVRARPLGNLGASPNPPGAEAIRDLIQELGDEAIEKRDGASRKLLLLGKHAEPHLRKALEDADVEVRARAEMILGTLKVLASTPAVEVLALAVIDEVVADAPAAREEAAIELAGLLAGQDASLLRRPGLRTLLLDGLQGTDAARRASVLDLLQKVSGETHAAGEIEKWRAWLTSP